MFFCQVIKGISMNEWCLFIYLKRSVYLCLQLNSCYVSYTSENFFRPPVFNHFIQLFVQQLHAHYISENDMTQNNMTRCIVPLSFQNKLHRPKGAQKSCGRVWG